MRPLLIVLLLCVLVLGALFGALNAARVPVDFYFGQVDVSVGAALLCALLLGWLLGGLVAWLGHVPKLRRLTRMVRHLQSAQSFRAGADERGTGT